MHGIVHGDFVPGAVLAHQCRHRVLVNLGHGLLALLFIGNLIGLVQPVGGQFAHAQGQHFIGRRRLPVPGGFAGLAGQLVDGLDDHLLLLVSEHHRPQHHRFAQFLGLGFHHEHGVFRAGDDQIQLGILQLLVRRVEQILTVPVAHPGGADGAVERHAGQFQGRRGTYHGGDVRIDVRIAGHDGGNNLNFVKKTFGEQGPQRPVNEPGNQGFALAGAAFPFKEATGHPAGGVEFFLIING